MAHEQAGRRDRGKHLYADGARPATNGDIGADKFLALLRRLQQPSNWRPLEFVHAHEGTGRDGDWSRSCGGKGGRGRRRKKRGCDGAVKHGGYHVVRPRVLVVARGDVGGNAGAVALDAVLPSVLGVTRRNSARIRRGGTCRKCGCRGRGTALEGRVLSFEFLDSSLEGSDMGYRRSAVLFDGQTNLPHLLQHIFEVDVGSHID